MMNTYLTSLDAAPGDNFDDFLGVALTFFFLIRRKKRFSFFGPNPFGDKKKLVVVALKK